MKIIIPMAGLGDRFKRAGYIEPKPLIKVNNKMIIEYIIDMFSQDDEYIFICNENHINETDIVNILNGLVSNCKIISIPQHKKGPVFTTKFAFEHIKDDEEVIVCYCDNPYIWDNCAFREFLKNRKPDGCILSHTGFHPHTLSSTKMAFIKNKMNSVLEIKEKECYTDNPLKEHASTGTYYFKTGSLVKKYFQKAIEQNIQYNGEYYVTLVYNLLIQDHLDVVYYDTPLITVFGTPEEVAHFEAWQVILTEKQVKNEEDLINSYRYWKKYNSHDTN